MTTFRIECYTGTMQNAGGVVPVPEGYLGTKAITIATSSARVVLFTGTKVVSISHDDTVDVFYNFGDSAVTAAVTDRPVGQNDTKDRSPDGNTYIACIKA